MTEEQLEKARSDIDRVKTLIFLGSTVELPYEKRIRYLTQGVIILSQIIESTIPKR